MSRSLSVLIVGSRTFETEEKWVFRETGVRMLLTMSADLWEVVAMKARCSRWERLKRKGIR